MPAAICACADGRYPRAGTGQRGGVSWGETSLGEAEYGLDRPIARQHPIRTTRMPAAAASCSAPASPAVPPARPPSACGSPTAPASKASGRHAGHRVPDKAHGSHWRRGACPGRRRGLRALSMRRGGDRPGRQGHSSPDGRCRKTACTALPCCTARRSSPALSMAARARTSPDNFRACRKPRAPASAATSPPIPPLHPGDTLTLRLQTGEGDDHHAGRPAFRPAPMRRLAPPASFHVRRPMPA